VSYRSPPRLKLHGRRELGAAGSICVDTIRNVEFALERIDSNLSTRLSLQSSHYLVTLPCFDHVAILTPAVRGRGCCLAVSAVKRPGFRLPIGSNGYQLL
jgi:hypothetical protein